MTNFHKVMLRHITLEQIARSLLGQMTQSLTNKTPFTSFPCSMFCPSFLRF